MSLLRSDEVPNPTPGFVRRVRRHGELMAAAAGVSNSVLARQFGYRDAAGARAAVERARDLVAPDPDGEPRCVEHRRTERIVGALAAHVAAGDHIAVGTYLETLDIRAQLQEAANVEVFPQRHPDGVDQGPIDGDRGSWTPMLQYRAEDASFHRIASEFGIDDWYDAATTTHRDLHAYHQRAARLLRAVQLRDIDQRFHALRHVALGSPCDVDAAATSIRLLHRRAKVRGLFWVEPNWWWTPCPPHPIP